MKKRLIFGLLAFIHVSCSGPVNTLPGAKECGRQALRQGVSSNPRLNLDVKYPNSSFKIVDSLYSAFIEHDSCNQFTMIGIPRLSIDLWGPLDSERLSIGSRSPGKSWANAYSFDTAGRPTSEQQWYSHDSLPSYFEILRISYDSLIISAEFSVSCYKRFQDSLINPDSVVAITGTIINQPFTLKEILY